jgi:hypothetical protein
LFPEPFVQHQLSFSSALTFRRGEEAIEDQARARSCSEAGKFVRPQLNWKKGEPAVKKMIILPIWLGLTLPVVAQGTMDFSAVLTGNTLKTGSGTFTLRTNNLFYYKLTTPYGYSQAQVRSPWPEPNAAPVFDLGIIGCVPPEPYPGTNAGFCYFEGGVLLSDSEIADLLAGRWYAYSLSPTAPSRPIQGQIVLVPEPSSSLLVALALCFFAAGGPHRRRAPSYAQQRVNDPKPVQNLKGTATLRGPKHVLVTMTLLVLNGLAPV